MNEPLIWTTKGNLPVASLEYATRWELGKDCQLGKDYVKFIETYRLNGEIVKESAHVLILCGAPLGADQGAPA